jgi:superfamily II DNA or RNA helicase
MAGPMSRRCRDDHASTYQEQVVTQIRDALRRCRRVLASPTGSGKTIMFVWLAMAVAAHAAGILILGHRQKIVDQVSEALRAFDEPHGIIAQVTPRPTMRCKSPA